MFDFSFIFSPNHLIRVWFKSSFIFNMLCLFDFGVVFIWFRSKSSVVISLISLSAICSLWYPSLLSDILHAHCYVPCPCSCNSPVPTVWFCSLIARMVLVSFWSPVCPSGSDLLLSEGCLSGSMLWVFHWNMIAVSYWFLCNYYLIVVSTSFYCYLFMVLLSHCHLLLVLISTI